VTQGFNPRMRVSFCPALPVGTAGNAEVYDVWLTRLLRPDDALAALRGATPEGLAPVSVRYIGEREPSLGAAMTLADYEVVVEGPDMGPGTLAGSLDDVIGSGSREVEHKGPQRGYARPLSVRGADPAT